MFVNWWSLEWGALRYWCTNLFFTAKVLKSLLWTEHDTSHPSAIHSVLSCWSFKVGQQPSCSSLFSNLKTVHYNNVNKHEKWKEIKNILTETNLKSTTNCVQVMKIMFPPPYFFPRLPCVSLHPQEGAIAPQAALNIVRTWVRSLTFTLSQQCEQRKCNKVGVQLAHLYFFFLFSKKVQ